MAALYWAQLPYGLLDFPRDKDDDPRSWKVCVMIMNDADVKRLLHTVPFRAVPVTVKANDYAYDGWLIGGGTKRSGALRVMIEDGNGRIFIHSAGELRTK